MTLAALSPDRARCIANPAKVAAAESALLAVLHDRPRLTTAEIAVALGSDKRSGLKARIYRMADRGAIEKAGRGRWRIAGQKDEPEFEPRSVEPEPIKPELGDRPFPRWVTSVNSYVRIETSPFACTRYG